MEKKYSKPMTETTHVSLVNTLLTASGLKETDGILKQNLGGAGTLDEGDTGGDNLSKSGGLWD